MEHRRTTRRYPNGIAIAEYERLIAADPDLQHQSRQRMVRKPEVFARGKVRHVDHVTIILVWLAPRQIHCVGKTGFAARTERAAGSRNQPLNLMADVMADNHPVPQILEKLDKRFRLIGAAARLIVVPPRRISSSQT